MDPLSAAQTRFSLDLFRKIREENTSGNVFYSPLSISAALSMLSLGAGGQTATQMSRVRNTHTHTHTHTLQVWWHVKHIRSRTLANTLLAVNVYILLWFQSH